MDFGDSLPAEPFFPRANSVLFQSFASARSACEVCATEARRIISRQRADQKLNCQSSLDCSSIRSAYRCAYASKAALDHSCGVFVAIRGLLHVDTFKASFSCRGRDRTSTVQCLPVVNHQRLPRSFKNNVNWPYALFALKHKPPYLKSGPVLWHKEQLVPSEDLIGKHVQQVHLAVEAAARTEHRALHQCYGYYWLQISIVEQLRADDRRANDAAEHHVSGRAIPMR